MSFSMSIITRLRPYLHLPESGYVKVWILRVINVSQSSYPAPRALGCRCHAVVTTEISVMIIFIRVLAEKLVLSFDDLVNDCAFICFM